MNELERFKAVVHFEKPDYWPLVTVDGLGYVHKGGLRKLHREGLPARVNDLESWCAYWGQCTFDYAEFIGADAPGIQRETWTKGDFEFVRSETGALTRKPIGNDMLYCMPDFVEFDVRDRASWETYRQLTRPRRRATEKLEAMNEKFAQRTRPLAVHCEGTWGIVRMRMGPERALLALYDDPDLVRDIIAANLADLEEFVFPVIEALRPEIVTMWEDFCYNHGMLISPAAFREFCAPYYRRVVEVGRACGAELMIVDSDGKVDEYCRLLEEVGLNGCWPMEQVCGNDLLAYRRAHPRFIFAGGIEKEIANTGQARRIEPELAPKIPAVLESSGYFPMFDHALQVDVGFAELCRCMTRLHEICGSDDLGEFPRVSS